MLAKLLGNTTFDAQLELALREEDLLSPTLVALL